MTIVIHCVQNFVPTDLSTIKMVKAKRGVGETMILKPRAKAISKASSKANEQGQGVGMAITHDLFIRLEKLISNMASQKLEEKKVVAHCSTSAPTYLRLDPS